MFLIYLSLTPNFDCMIFYLGKDDESWCTYNYEYLHDLLFYRIHFCFLLSSLPFGLWDLVYMFLVHFRIIIFQRYMATRIVSLDILLFRVKRIDSGNLVNSQWCKTLWIDDTELAGLGIIVSHYFSPPPVLICFKKWIMIYKVWYNASWISGIVLIGEIGGTAEEDAAALIKVLAFLKSV